MKKKMLAVLLLVSLTLSLTACGGGEDTSAADEAVVATDVTDVTDDAGSTAEYTEEQAQFAQEYIDMCAAYDEAVNLVNATPELLEDQELVTVMNDLTASIDSVDELFEDPANLTPEAMDELRTAFADVYSFIDEVNNLVGAVSSDGEANAVDDLASVLTIAYGGADDAGNTYYFACDQDVTFGSYFILSADMTQNAYCVGNIVDNGDGTLTINDEEGYTTTFAVEEAEGGVILTLEDGTTVGMAAWEPSEIIEMMLTIEQQTQNVNQ